MKASSFLQEKYEEERLKDLVNKLNTLYVGFTRAEDELYIIGVQGKRDQRPDPSTVRQAHGSGPGTGTARGAAQPKYQFPIDLLQAMDSPIGSKNPPRVRPVEAKQKDLRLYHHPDPVRFPIAAMGELNLEERLRGEFIHRVLYRVESLDEKIESHLEEVINRVNDELKTDYPAEAVKKKLLEFLGHEEIRPCFQTMPGRVIKREQDFSDGEGNLFRMDRVIFEEDRVSVIDYKTGTDKEGEREYISQLKNYIRILKEVYPDKDVEGVILYVDLKEVTKVSPHDA
jgi:ATP-dependent exoDNAse (exonuclease V) beta subunit